MRILSVPPHDQRPAADPFGIAMGDGAWNIMFAILAASISLVPATLSTVHDLGLELAHASPTVEAATPQETIRVTIDAEGIVRLNQAELGPAEDVAHRLPRDLQGMIQDQVGKSYRVWIIPDKGASWQCVVDAYDAVGQVTSNFSVIAEGREEQ